LERVPLDVGEVKKEPCRDRWKKRVSLELSKKLWFVCQGKKRKDAEGEYLMESTEKFREKGKTKRSLGLSLESKVNGRGGPTVTDCANSGESGRI